MATLTRRERSRATHQRIVEAAHRLFTTQGYASTTMAQVAESAGVAVQTVYFVFHTKAALLARTIDFAVLGWETPRPPQEQPWYRAMEEAPGIAEALRHLVTGVGEIMPRVIPLNLAARASDDPELAGVMAESEAWRADGYRVILDILARQGAAPRGARSGAGDAPPAAVRGRGRLPRPRRDVPLVARGLGRLDGCRGAARGVRADIARARRLDAQRSTGLAVCRALAPEPGAFQSGDGGWRRRQPWARSSDREEALRGVAWSHTEVEAAGSHPRIQRPHSRSSEAKKE